MDRCEEDDEGEYLYTKHLLDNSNIVAALEAANDTGMDIKVGLALIQNMVKEIPSIYSIQFDESVVRAALDNDIEALCKYLMRNHWSTVDIYYPSATAVRIQQDLKVTFSDKIATFGKQA